MPVITHDVTVRGLRRDAVYAWLADPGNHERLLREAFHRVRSRGPGIYDLEIGMPAAGGSLTYEITGPDDGHGGRRVHARLRGTRGDGTLHWSLRTTPPSTDTLVTLHVDYEPSGTLWRVADSLYLRRRLEAAWCRVAAALPGAIGAAPPAASGV